MKLLEKVILADNSTSIIFIRIVVGTVFLSEGIQKFLFPDVVGAGRFQRIGFEIPEFWASFTACFEIVCGSAILLGFLTRVASVPLLIVMATAFVTTKWPLLLEMGFWNFAHEYRTDFAMTVLLLALLTAGSGSISVDRFISHKN